MWVWVKVPETAGLSPWFNYQGSILGTFVLPTAMWKKWARTKHSVSIQLLLETTWL